MCKSRERKHGKSRERNLWQVADEFKLTEIGGFKR